MHNKSKIDLSIFIEHSGPNKNIYNLIDCISSLNKGTKNKEIIYYLSTDKPDLRADLYNLIPTLVNEINLEVHSGTNSWASNANKFILKYIDLSNWMLFAHDDLILETENFLETVENTLHKVEEKIGWITFTSNGWYRSGNVISNSLRPGFFIDRHSYPLTFEASDFFKGDKLISWEKNLPKAAVWAHGPFSHLNLIKNDSLQIVGLFPNWTAYTIMLDENQSLEALKNNLINLWIPSIQYFHPNRPRSRKVGGIRFERSAHEAFFRKWGILEPYTDYDIDLVCDKFSSTLIPWSVGRYSYDWKYLV